MIKKRYSRMRGGFMGSLGRMANKTPFQRYRINVSQSKGITRRDFVSKSAGGRYSFTGLGAAAYKIYNYVNKNFPNAGPEIAGFIATKLGSKPENVSSVLAAVNNGLKVSRPKYKRVINKGTQLTKTQHNVGSNIELPEVVRVTGTKYIETRSENITDAFVLTNEIAVTNPQREHGVAQSIYWTGSQIKNVQDNMIGTYSGVSTNQPLALGAYLGEFYLDNTYSETRFTSASNFNQKIRIYELVAKISTISASFANPIFAWRDGIDNTAGSADSLTYRQIGIFPSHSKNFREAWAVEGVYDVELPAGASHIHTSDYKQSLMVPNMMFQGDLNSANNMQAGVTRARLYVLDTTPIHSAETFDPSLTTGAVDVVVVNTYTTYGIPFKNTALAIVNSLPFIDDPALVTQNTITDTAAIFTG